MATKQIIIQNFSGGIADDLRQQVSNGFATSQHFDNYSSLNKLTPYDISVADNTTQVGIMAFNWDGTNLYGMGVNLSSGPKVQIYQKTSLINNWVSPSTSTSNTVTSIIGNGFHIYKGFAYMYAAANRLDRWALGGAYTDSYQSLTFTAYGDASGNVAQPITHSKTDTAYFPYENKIASLNGTSFTTTALTLPSNLVITALAQFGNYLAIACRPSVSGSANSRVFLWDMVSFDVSESIDFGTGDLWILANVEGALVGVMNAPTSAGITQAKTKVFIKAYTSGVPVLIKTLIDVGLVLGGLTGYKPFVSTTNGLSFYLTSGNGINGVVPTGIYTVNKVPGNSGFNVVCERYVHNTSGITSLTGIFKIGEVIFTAYNHVANTSSSVGRTDNPGTYTITSYIETVKINGGDINKRKKLDFVGVSTVPMPTTGQIIIKYKKNSETAYTTIATNTTDNAVSNLSPNIAGSVTLPEFNEIQFRVESTGGAEITGIKIVFTELKSDYRTLT